MIIKEYYATREDGVKLYRTYSDQQYYITREGIMYADAVDPEEYADRTYEETNIQIENETEPSPEETYEALDILLNGTQSTEDN